MSFPRSGADPFHLQRFIDAQLDVFETARGELASGRKRSHWMWFIFPQIQGLGSSSMAQRFAIANLQEASAYLQHPVLGERLRECTSLVNTINDLSVSDIFGDPDDLKFHSSITLFDRAFHSQNSASGPDNVFARALSKYFAGRLDEGTLARL